MKKPYNSAYDAEYLSNYKEHPLIRDGCYIGDVHIQITEGFRIISLIIIPYLDLHQVSKRFFIQLILYLRSYVDAEFFYQQIQCSNYCE